MAGRPANHWCIATINREFGVATRSDKTMSIHQPVARADLVVCHPAQHGGKSERSPGWAGAYVC